jgi:hypothetical protein
MLVPPERRAKTAANHGDADFPFVSVGASDPFPRGNYDSRYGSTRQAFAERPAGNTAPPSLILL